MGRKDQFKVFSLVVSLSFWILCVCREEDSEGEREIGRQGREKDSKG